jgi:hypothetical protein
MLPSSIPILCSIENQFIEEWGDARLSMFWECQRRTTNDCSKKKAAPFLGPPFKEAERREVREDFARCRSAKQNDVSEVVENNGFW